MTTNDDDFNLNAYDYHLPQERIAQHPAEHRDQSKLMVIEGPSGSPKHLHFHDIIKYFKSNDILVVNNTRVFPARLLGRKETGGSAEVFLLSFPTILQAPPRTGIFPDDRIPAGKKVCEAVTLLKSSKRPKIGSTITISEDLHCRVAEYLPEGKVRVLLVFDQGEEITEILARKGQVPLPPYIERQGGVTEEDRIRYQTVYAREPGAVAAPTAGLHFTPEILKELEKKGVRMAAVTLHVGYGTFAPVRSEHILDHEIHSEYVTITEETADRINRVRKSGGRVWAVGTTSVRSLEFAATEEGEVRAVQGWCNLYITPGYHFRITDNLITNFHLPKSSLLFLVSALCGRKRLLACYEEAIATGYRFFSYGDAMAIIRK